MAQVGIVAVCLVGFLSLLFLAKPVIDTAVQAFPTRETMAATSIADDLGF